MLARRHSPEAILTLVTQMRTGEKSSDRIAAAKEILNRGLGLPPQSIDIAFHKKRIDELSAEQLREFRERYVASMIPLLAHPMIEVEAAADIVGNSDPIPVASDAAD